MSEPLYKWTPEGMVPAIQPAKKPASRRAVPPETELGTLFGRMLALRCNKCQSLCFIGAAGRRECSDCGLVHAWTTIDGIPTAIYT